ncbi:MAG: BNR-4 repeat-containing protein [Adhaeribacter sp.]
MFSALLRFLFFCALLGGPVLPAIAQSPAPAFQRVAEDAAWCWFSDPRAIFHQGTIYFGYINSRGDVVISARNKDTGLGSTYVLHERLQVDDHNVPAILVLPDGRISVFYTEHNGRFFMRTSKKAGDIASWEEERVLSFNLENKRLCYAHPVMLAGEQNRIYLFFRGTTPGLSYTGWGQYMSYSDDLGKTWVPARYFLDTKAINNACYLKVTSDHKSRIDFVFTDGHPKIGPASIYHVYYEKGKFHQTSGELLASLQQLPLQLPGLRKVYDVGLTHTKSWIWDIALDKKNRPVIAYAQYPSVQEHRYHYTRWDGKKWVDRFLLQAGGYITHPETSGKVLEEHYSGGVVLDHQRPDQVYLSRQVQGTFEIEHWQLKGNKWQTRALTQGSSASHIRPYVVDRYPGSKAIVLWMQGWYGHYTRFKTNLVMHQQAKTR